MTADEFTKVCAPWATLATIIVSLWGGYSQFRQLRHEQTVSRVFDMSKEYRASFLDVNLKFSDKWANYQNSLRTRPIVEVLSQYPKLVQTFLADADTRTQYETLGFFYNSLGECVKAKLCDFASANAIFGDDLLTYYDNMCPDLMLVKQHGYEADGILDFIARKKGIHCVWSSPPSTHTRHGK